MFKNVVVTPTGVKIGSKGRVMNTVQKVSETLGTMSKGAARQFRKKLYELGYKSFAAAPRKIEQERLAA